MSQDSEGSPSPIPTSQLNTNSGSQANPSSVILNSPDHLDALEKANAILEEELQKHRAERRAERFFWAFALIGGMNVLIASHAHWVATLTSILFSLLLSLGLGKWLEVPFIAPYLERWFEKWLGNIPRPDETE